MVKNIYEILTSGIIRYISANDKVQYLMLLVFRVKMELNITC